MAIILGLNGRPGSGKSALARYISDKFGQMRLEGENFLLAGLDIEHISDYPYLQDMFYEELSKNDMCCFKKSDCGGFDVVNDSVLGKVLESINAYLCSQLSNPRKLLLVEFARGSYQEAWGKFSPEVLDCAYFLYFDANQDMCLQRIKKRSEKGPFERGVDDNFVSEEIMEQYYRKDDFQEFMSNLPPGKARIVTNEGEWETAWDEVRTFLDTIASHYPELALPDSVAV